MTQNSINTKNPVIQYVKTSLSSLLLINSSWAFDTTKPQQTEGVELYTVTITPTNANNILVIKANAWGVVNNTSWITIALFQDAGANALNTAMGGQGNSDTYRVSAEKKYSQTAATTFKVRAGSLGNNWYVNGYGLTNYFGGTSNSYLEVMEIKV
jgi:hypothetical protein